MIEWTTVNSNLGGIYRENSINRNFYYRMYRFNYISIDARRKRSWVGFFNRTDNFGNILEQE